MGVLTILDVPEKTFGISGSVVLQIMNPFLEKGHNRYTDN